MSVVNPHHPQQTVVVYTQTAWSRFWGWMTWMGLLALLVVVLAKWGVIATYFDAGGNVEEKYVSGPKLGDDKLAIITISGVIMDGEGFVKNQIDKVRDDKKVKAVVVRVDSPGGTVSGSDYIFHHLKKLRDEKGIPLVVSMGGMAASGGYYVAMAVGDKEDTIFAEPTCSTGSIGVMIPHYDISGFLEKHDIKDDSLATHPRKLMLSMTREMTSEERELVQSHINDMFERFKEVVHEGRPFFKQNPAELDKLATGEIFTSEKALEFKLIDRIDYQEAAIERALELASLDKEKTRIIKYKRPVSLSDSLLFSRAPHGSAAGFDVATLLELSAPRAWYQATSLPDERIKGPLREMSSFR
jgi:protease-4